MFRTSNFALFSQAQSSAEEKVSVMFAVESIFLISRPLHLPEKGAKVTPSMHLRV